jgi:hypothetical protein
LDLIQDEILKCQTVDPNTCDLREFGMAIFDHTLALNEASQSAKFAAVAAPAKSKPRHQASGRTCRGRYWKQRLLDLTTKCEPIIARVQHGISNGWDWKSFSNNRAWKKTVRLVGKPLRDEAATLIQNLLKVAQSAWPNMVTQDFFNSSGQRAGVFDCHTQTTLIKCLLSKFRI